MIVSLVLIIGPGHAVDMESHRQVGALGKFHGIVHLTQEMGPEILHAGGSIDIVVVSAMAAHQEIHAV